MPATGTGYPLSMAQAWHTAIHEAAEHRASTVGVGSWRWCQTAGLCRQRLQEHVCSMPRHKNGTRAQHLDCNQFACFMNRFAACGSACGTPRHPFTTASMCPDFSSHPPMTGRTGFSSTQSARCSRFLHNLDTLVSSWYQEPCWATQQQWLLNATGPYGPGPPSTLWQFTQRVPGNQG
jgi:hypothetical protein